MAGSFAQNNPREVIAFTDFPTTAEPDLSGIEIGTSRREAKN